MKFYHIFLKSMIVEIILISLLTNSVFSGEINNPYERIIQSEKEFNYVLKHKTARSELIIAYDSLCTDRDLKKKSKASVQKLLYYPKLGLDILNKGRFAGDVFFDILSKVVILFSINYNTYAIGDILGSVLSIISVLYSATDAMITMTLSASMLLKNIISKMMSMNENISYYFFLNAYCRESLIKFKSDIQLACKNGKKTSANRCEKIKLDEKLEEKIETMSLIDAARYGVSKRDEKISPKMDPLRFSMLLTMDTKYWPGKGVINHKMRCRMLEEMRLKKDDESFIYDIVDNSLKFKNRAECDADIKNRLLIYIGKKKSRILKKLGIEGVVDPVFSFVSNFRNDKKSRTKLVEERRSEFNESIDLIKKTIKDLKEESKHVGSETKKELKELISKLEDILKEADDLINNDGSFNESLANAIEKDLTLLDKGISDEDSKLVCDAYERYAECRFEYIDLINSLDEKTASYFGFKDIDQNFFRAKKDSKKKGT